MPINPEDAQDQPVESLPDRAILLVVCAYAAAFVVFGLAVDGPAQVVRGLVGIVTTRDALLTDYFGIGGIGAGCVNAGLLTLCACFVYHRANARIDGAAVACLFLVLGFGLFGKNLFNIWSIVLGVYLYARFKREPFSAHINTAFFGAALAPVFSEILFSTSLQFEIRLPLALATSLVIGFILPAAAAQLFKAHMGFTLYNMGFAAGIVGTLVVAAYKSFGFVPDPVMIWTTGNNLLLGSFLATVLGSMIAIGYTLDRSLPSRLKAIVASSGQAPTDFIALAGFGPTLANMGLTGAVGTAYVLLVGGDLNGPVIGAILTIVGFSAFGKHPRNIAPIMLGVFLGSLANPWGAADPSLLLAALFGTTLAPIAGRFGWHWGIVAGLMHSSAASSVGSLHAGLNLYNNGFAAGLVAAVLVPVIIAIRAGCDRDRAAAPAPPAAEPTHCGAARDAWALLLARIYEVFPVGCPLCGAEMRIIAFITNGPTVRDILVHLGEPTAPPRIAPARGPPLLGIPARRAARDRSPSPAGTVLRVRSAHRLVATTVDACLCATLGWFVPAADVRDRRARRRARVTRAPRKNAPTAARNHPISPAARSRQLMIS